MSEYVNVVQASEMLDCSTAWFHKKHKKNLNHPTIRAGIKGHWWKSADVRRYAAKLRKESK